MTTQNTETTNLPNIAAQLFSDPANIEKMLLGTKKERMSLFNTLTGKPEKVRGRRKFEVKEGYNVCRPHYKKNREAGMNPEEAEKAATFEVSEFGTTNGKLSNRCKACVKETANRWGKRHPKEKVLATMRRQTSLQIENYERKIQMLRERGEFLENLSNSTDVENIELELSKLPKLRKLSYSNKKARAAETNPQPQAAVNPS